MAQNGRRHPVVIGHQLRFDNTAGGKQDLLKITQLDFSLSDLR